jgi:hypothetical protein
MSGYYRSYSDYLGAQRCCDSRGPGPVGPAGPTGPGSVGPRGYTGPTGESVTGPTGRDAEGRLDLQAALPVLLVLQGLLVVLQGKLVLQVLPELSLY